MNRENYQRVKEIFQAVLELAPDERRPHLDRVCTDDPELPGEVEPLIELKVNRTWDFVRDDPRFEELVKRVGIP